MNTGNDAFLHQWISRIAITDMVQVQLIQWNTTRELHGREIIIEVTIDQGSQEKDNALRTTYTCTRFYVQMAW